TFLLGTVLLALEFARLPASGKRSVPALTPPLHPRGRRIWGYVCLALAGVLGALALRGLVATSPDNRAIITWLAALATALVGMILADRARGTRFGNPFAQWWEPGLLVLLMVLEVLLIAHDLTDWHWAGVPDEANFFDVAKSIATGHSERFLL